ncbi:MAG TPA: hypothetical protein VEW46_21115 [Pyrinomonadaceae bacterium]|nr:hypothetical protein [Pyrinomonadaceae bacterium]
MISNNPILDQHSLSVGATGRWIPSEPEPGTCAWYLERIVVQIDSAEVKETVQVVFADLLRLLECLSLIEAHLRQVDSADETFALFQLIHDDARGLVEFVRTDAMNCAGISDELADTLDGITFVINHDLQRVFESDSRRSLSDKTTHVILSKVHRAHDVLTNCLQQSTISLAMVFDRSLVGAKLFDNSDMRYRQSLQLCQDLLTLRQLVENFEEQAGELALTNLTSGITKFRNESMECLMYSDWPQFESFCETIKVASTDFPRLVEVLHQFQCYLETLLSQVRMRAVLAERSSFSGDVPTAFDFGGPDETSSSQREDSPFALAV